MYEIRKKYQRKNEYNQNKDKDNAAIVEKNPPQRNTFRRKQYASGSTTDIFDAHKKDNDLVIDINIKIKSKDKYNGRNHEKGFNNNYTTKANKYNNNTEDKEPVKWRRYNKYKRVDNQNEQTDNNYDKNNLASQTYRDGRNSNYKSYSITKTTSIAYKRKTPSKDKVNSLYGKSEKEGPIQIKNNYESIPNENKYEYKRERYDINEYKSREELELAEEKEKEDKIQPKNRKHFANSAVNGSRRYNKNDNELEEGQKLDNRDNKGKYGRYGKHDITNNKYNKKEDKKDSDDYNNYKSRFHYKKYNRNDNENENDNNNDRFNKKEEDSSYNYRIRMKYKDKDNDKNANDKYNNKKDEDGDYHYSSKYRNKYEDKNNNKYGKKDDNDNIYKYKNNQKENINENNYNNYKSNTNSQYDEKTNNNKYGHKEDDNNTNYKSGINNKYNNKYNKYNKGNDNDKYDKNEDDNTNKDNYEQKNEKSYIRKHYNNYGVQNDNNKDNENENGQDNDINNNYEIKVNINSKKFGNDDINKNNINNDNYSTNSNSNTNTNSNTNHNNKKKYRYKSLNKDYVNYGETIKEEENEDMNQRGRYHRLKVALNEIERFNAKKALKGEMVEMFNKILKSNFDFKEDIFFKNLIDTDFKVGDMDSVKKRPVSHTFKEIETIEILRNHQNAEDLMNKYTKRARLIVDEY